MRYDAQNSSAAECEEITASRSKNQRPGHYHGSGSKVEGRRVSTNSKERGRQQSVSGAFSELRALLPAHPPDRKLSKNQTLRLALRYIHFLSMLAAEQEGSGGRSLSDQVGSGGQSLQCGQVFPDFRSSPSSCDSFLYDSSPGGSTEVLSSPGSSNSHQYR